MYKTWLGYDLGGSEYQGPGIRGFGLDLAGKLAGAGNQTGHRDILDSQEPDRSGLVEYISHE